MIYIGIDPGVTGGIAALLGDGSVLLAAKMPETDKDIYDLLSQLPINRGVMDTERHAMLERVNAGAFRLGGKMGVTSAFTFGGIYRALAMALTAAGIPFDRVMPMKWQQYMGCRSHGDKNVTKRRAQELWPRFTITHAVADALLIAEYGRRVRTATSVRVAP